MASKSHRAPYQLGAIKHVNGGYVPNTTKHPQKMTKGLRRELEKLKRQNPAEYERRVDLLRSWGVSVG